MNIDIEQLTNFINDVINNGLPIKDEFTWHAAISNGVLSGLSTVIGGALAIWGARTQDKKRIREDIKLSRYNQFQVSYENMYIYVNNYVNHIKGINLVYSEDEEWNLRFINGQIINFKIIVSLNSPFQWISKIRNKVNEIHKFVQSNKLILGFNDNPYDDILHKVNEIYELFREVDFLYRVYERNNFNMIYNQDIENEMNNFNNKVSKLRK